MNDEVAFGVVFIAVILIGVTVYTIQSNNIPILTYIALVFVVAELIYLQIIKYIDDDIRKFKTEIDLLNATVCVKLISIALALAIIPTITLILYIINLILMSLLEIATVLCIVILIIGIIYTYIYINTYPIRLRKKQLEKENRKDKKIVNKS